MRRTAATSPSRTAPTSELMANRSTKETKCRTPTICSRLASKSSACCYKAKPAPELEIDENAFPLAVAQPLLDGSTRNDVHGDLLAADAAALPDALDFERALEADDL